MSYNAYLSEESSMFAALESQLSTEDRAVMDVLPTVDLPGWMATRIEDYRSRIRALMSAQNALVPINHKLPPEVLMQIFISLNANDPSRLWFRVLHVCRLWRSMIFRTPAFWVGVLSIKKDLVGVTEGSVARLQLFLELSRALPLDLSLKGLPHSASQALAPHISRISSLTLRLKGKEYKSFTRLLSSGMALLERLSIQHRDDDKHVTEFRRTLVKDASHLPRLHSLTLSSMFIDLGVLAGQLRHLNLPHCYCTFCHGRRAPLQGLLQALKGCSSLEYLAFEEASMDITDDHPPVNQDHIIALPALRKLRIYRGKIPTAALLSRVSLPGTCTLDIDDLDAQSLRDTLPEDLRTFQQVALADSFRFEFLPEKHGILKTFAGNSLLLRTFASGYKRRDVVKHGFASFVTELTVIFAPPTAISTTLVLRTPPAFKDAKDKDRAALHALLEAFPLAHLDTTAYNGTDDILSLLGEPLPAGGYLCPSLEGLTVRWRFSMLGEYRSSRDNSWLWTLKPPAPLRTASDALGTFCDAVAKVVEQRSNVVPLKLLRVVVHPAVYERSTTELEEKWNGPTTQELERLQMRLGHLVGSIAVEFDGDNDSAR